MNQITEQLSPPPRPVPALLRCQALVGSPISQFGWIFFGFGMIFFWAFGAPGVLHSMFLARLPVQSAQGQLVDIRETNASENESPVFAYHFTFVADGRRFDGVSYVTGSSDVGKPGELVPIEYPEGHPANSRIAGMRSTTFGGFVLFVAIFPAVGLLLLIPGLLQGLKANRLLAHGRPAVGVLKSKEKTNTKINGRRVYRLKFQFTGEDGMEHTATASTHTPERLQDDAEEALLYDPRRPSYAVMLDGLPASAAIGPDGHLQAPGIVRGALVLAIPVLVILGHGTYVYYAYLR